MALLLSPNSASVGTGVSLLRTGLRVVGRNNVAGGVGSLMAFDTLRQEDWRYRNQTSHHGSGFQRHQTRWDVGRHVPIPYRRGVTFRGDYLGGDLSSIPAIAG